MKIVNKYMFDVAQHCASEAVKTGSEHYWMCAKEYLKLAYGL